ncbi:MAG: hypothetical protein IPM51_06875 [Sphingobacteriaceae bacterium]|nr:hypothetical protein [Sphingobacteriaceae bacterium]
MIKISTPENSLTNTLSKPEIKLHKLESEPSALTIANIIGYSKNLEIKKSEFVTEFQILKS